MDKEWIALIGVGAGGIIAGGFASLNNYVSFLRQEKQKRREDQLRHIEEIYECLDKVENGITYFYTNQVCSMFQGKVNDLKQAPEIPLGRLELLVKLYCPTLTSPFTQLKEVRDQCGVHFTSALWSLAAKEQEKMISELQSVTKSLKEFASKSEEMRSRIISFTHGKK